MGIELLNANEQLIVGDDGKLAFINQLNGEQGEFKVAWSALHCRGEWVSFKMFKLFKGFNYRGKCAKIVSQETGATPKDSMDYVDDFVQLFAGCMHNNVSPENAVLLCSNGVLSFYLDEELDGKRSSEKSAIASVIAYAICRNHCVTAAPDDPWVEDGGMPDRVSRFEKMGAFSATGIYNYIKLKGPKT